MRLLDFDFSPQEINYDSKRGGVSVITEKGEITTSYLLIQRAKLADSGKYTCSPLHANPITVNVHVLNGEFGSSPCNFPCFPFIPLLSQVNILPPSNGDQPTQLIFSSCSYSHLSFSHFKGNFLSHCNSFTHPRVTRTTMPSTHKGSEKKIKILYFLLTHFINFIWKKEKFAKWKKKCYSDQKHRGKFSLDSLKMFLTFQCN
jgi:hypothetical protein